MASSVSLAAAFLAGLFSFVSPCVLPIVPGYLSFISGVNVAQFKGGAAPSDLVRRVVLASLAFVLGFSTVFVSLGAAATLVGALLQQHKRTLGMIGGVIILVLGLHTMGILRIPWLLGEKRANVTQKPLGPLGAYVVGLAFAFGWTPCIGPILGAILLYALPAGDGRPGRRAAGRPTRLASASRSWSRPSPSIGSSRPPAACASGCMRSRSSREPS
jgi:cytochrome c-type biogenesis protein